VTGTLDRGGLLLDVNVLVALFDADHVHHETAHDWFADHRDDGWATCPITENGFLRVAARLSAPGAPLRPASLIEHFRKFCRSRAHRFWGNTLSLRDPEIFDLAFAAGPSQLTDIYLLGLARKNGGRLATFDRTIPLKAVVGATVRSLAVIGSDDAR
jgi:toxin-antitoxin system PIN domain toxin